MARAKGPGIFGPDFGPFTLLVRFAAKADPKTGHGRTPGLRRAGSAIKHCFIINVLAAVARGRQGDVGLFLFAATSHHVASTTTVVVRGPQT